MNIRKKSPPVKLTYRCLHNNAPKIQECGTLINLRQHKYGPINSLLNTNKHTQMRLRTQNTNKKREHNVRA